MYIMCVILCLFSALRHRVGALLFLLKEGSKEERKEGMKEEWKEGRKEGRKLFV